MPGNPRGLALEPAAQRYTESAVNPPSVFELPVSEARKVIDSVQDYPIGKPRISEEWVEVVDARASVNVRIVRPPTITSTLPAILYVHGAGWMFGNAHTHDRLVRDLAVRSDAAVVFVEYSLAPEARYPTAIEQICATARWVRDRGVDHGLDGTRIALCGDSVGANMAIAAALLAGDRRDVAFQRLVAFYPVTDASFDTASYRDFGEGYPPTLAGMRCIWDSYTSDERQRSLPTVSPLRASRDQLARMPDTLIITAEADPIRDEGEEFAARLRRAGVKATNARFGGITHDFVVVNSLHDTEASKHAVLLAAASLRSALHGDPDDLLQAPEHDRPDTDTMWKGWNGLLDSDDSDG